MSCRSLDTTRQAVSERQLSTPSAHSSADICIVSVSDVEELTKLNFLEKIPARDRRRVESLKYPMRPTKKKCPEDDA